MLQDLKYLKKKEWQVIFTDKKLYRCGIYSPKYSKPSQIERFERHSCPEIFLLISGRISLVLIENNKKRISRNGYKPFPTKELNKSKIVRLQIGKPVVVNMWHNGFCPDGKFTGLAFVVERAKFRTKYKNLK